MGFNAVSALWLLPLLGLIILMYLLKEEHEEMEISSLYLWKKVLADSEVKKPWQKLKNNILMLLQLLAAFLIIIALSNPFLKSGKALGGNIIIVVDRSGSMNAKTEGKKRIEIAKSMAERVIREAPSSSMFTVISTDREAKVEISNTKDKGEAINKIKAIEATNMSGSIKNQLSLVKAVYKQFQDAFVLAYTDEPFSLDDMKGEVMNLGEKGENAGITNISYSDEGEDYSVLVRIENTGENTIKREVTLYGDDRLLGLKEVEILPKSSQNLYFHGIEKDYEYLWAELSEEDMLMEDNKAYLVLKTTKPKKALMVSKGNIFIEKALSSIEGFELYKTDSLEIKDNTYDLYIFDGGSPNQMPKNGSFLFINPDLTNAFIKVGATTDGGMAYFEKHSLNKYMEDNRFFVNKMKDIDKPYWADSLIILGDNTAAAAGILQGRKIAYISFDIHESDFPLNSAFPIFMYNISSYLVDLETRGKGFYQSGENIDIGFIPDIQDAVMIAPSGQEESISEYMISYGFDSTGDTGIYRLSYKKDDALVDRIFAVNFPGEESKNAFKEWTAEKSNVGTGQNYMTGLDIRMPLIVIVLMILLAEWVVYVRD